MSPSAGRPARRQPEEGFVSRSRFVPDRRLATRMVVTLFVLGLVYVLFAAFFVGFFGARSIPVVLVVAGGFLLFQWYAADRVALAAMRARVVTPAEAPQLHGTVDRLCALADMPKPRVAVADTDVPNAFATGRSQQRAVLVVTTGLLRRLDGAELEGVLSHELAHVAHKDVAVMTIASFLGILAGLVARFGVEFGFWGGGRRSRDNNLAVVVLFTVVVSAVVYAISFLLIRALSRYRELSADRSAALLTGRPSELASALTKLTGEMGRIPTRDLRAAQPLQAFFFAPLAASGGLGLGGLLATHPSLQARLDQLARISAELGRAG